MGLTLYFSTPDCLYHAIAYLNMQERERGGVERGGVERERGGVERELEGRRWEWERGGVERGGVDSL